MERFKDLVIEFLTEGFDRLEGSGNFVYAGLFRIL
jgi:hypothetical protein